MKGVFLAHKHDWERRREVYKIQAVYLLVEVDFPIHAVIHPTKAAVRIRNEAMLCESKGKRTTPKKFIILV